MTFAPRRVRCTLDGAEFFAHELDLDYEELSAYGFGAGRIWVRVATYVADGAAAERLWRGRELVVDRGADWRPLRARVTGVPRLSDDRGRYVLRIDALAPMPDPEPYVPEPPPACYVGRRANLSADPLRAHRQQWGRIEDARQGPLSVAEMRERVGARLGLQRASTDSDASPPKST